jgi:hypothetical protein
MKKSTQFNFKPTIEPTLNSVSPVSRNASYGIDSDLNIDDFDPALELKRLRQELIERLIIIQRKAALNTKSDNQEKLTVTIVPKPIQTTPILHPKITTSNKITTELAEKKHDKLNNINIEITSRNKNTNSNTTTVLLNDSERSAERIMANIESARTCISELQMSNANQPQFKNIADKLSNNQQPTETSQLNEQYQTQQFTENINTDININCNVNSETQTLQNSPTQQK